MLCEPSFYVMHMDIPSMYQSCFNVMLIKILIYCRHSIDAVLLNSCQVLSLHNVHPSGVCISPGCIAISPVSCILPTSLAQ